MSAITDQDKGRGSDQIMRQTIYCSNCLEPEQDCTCEYALVLQALGMDHEVTLAEAAQAAIAESRYIRASIDAQLRRTRHTIQTWR